MAHLTEPTHTHEPKDDSRCAKCRALLKAQIKKSAPAPAETSAEERLTKQW